jgi:hypothetical protein
VLPVNGDLLACKLTVTRPPASGVNNPACTAATQIAESARYTSVPMTVVSRFPFGGQSTVIGPAKSSGSRSSVVFQPICAASVFAMKEYV